MLFGIYNNRAESSDWYIADNTITGNSTWVPREQENAAETGVWAHGQATVRVACFSRRAHRLNLFQGVNEVLPFGVSHRKHVSYPRPHCLPSWLRACLAEESSKKVSNVVACGKPLLLHASCAPAQLRQADVETA